MACKKQDENPPTVSIISRNASKNLNYGDTIWVTVKGEAGDDFGLQSVTVRVLDQQQKSWLRSDAKQLNGASATEVIFAIVIDDRYMPSGSYYVKAFLNDGTHESTDFVSYSINGLSKQWTGLVALNNTGTGGAVLDTLSDNGSWGPVMSFSGSRNHLMFDPFSQQCWTHGESVSQYQWSTLSGMLMADEVIPYSFSNLFFNDVALDLSNQGVWTACADGHVRRIRTDGSIGADVLVNYPQKIAASRDFIMVESEVPGIPERLVFFHPTTGQMIHTWIHGESVQDLQILGDQLWIVVQRPTGMQLMLFDLNTLLNINWSNFYSFTSQQYFASASMNSRVAMSTENGITVWDSEGTMVQQFPNAHPTQLEWDVVNGRLFGLENGQIHAYSISSGLATTWSGTGYSSFALCYNK
jgi:hypothetical protein